MPSKRYPGASVAKVISEEVVRLEAWEGIFFAAKAVVLFKPEGYEWHPFLELHRCLVSSDADSHWLLL
jgi:hypothetical protein